MLQKFYIHYIIRINKLSNAEFNVTNEEKELLNLDGSELSYERRINLMNVSENIKAKAIDKLNH